MQSLSNPNLYVNEEDCCHDNVQFVVRFLSQKIPGLKVCPKGEELVPELDLYTLRTRERLTAKKDGKTINVITAYWLGEALADTDCLIRLTTGVVKNLGALRNNARIYLSPEDNRDPIDKNLLQGALRLKATETVKKARAKMQETTARRLKTLSFRCMYLDNISLRKLKAEYERFVLAKPWPTSLDLSHNMAHDAPLIEFLSVSKTYGLLDLSASAYNMKTFQLFSDKLIKNGALQIHSLCLSNVGLTGARLVLLTEAFSKAPARTRCALEHLDLSENQRSYPNTEWATLFKLIPCPFPNVKTLEFQPLDSGPYEQGDTLKTNIQIGTFPLIEKVVVDNVPNGAFQTRITSAVRRWHVDCAINRRRNTTGEWSEKLADAKRVVRVCNEHHWSQPHLCRRFDTLKELYLLTQTLGVKSDHNLNVNEFLEIWSDPGTEWRTHLRQALDSPEGRDLIYWGVNGLKRFGH